MSSFVFLLVGAALIVIAGYLLPWTDSYPGSGGYESRTFDTLAPSLIRADQLAPVLVIVTLALWITPALSVLSPLTVGGARYAAIALMALALVGAIIFAIVNETQLKAKPDPGFAIALIIFALVVCGFIAWLAWRGRTW